MKTVPYDWTVLDVLVFLGAADSPEDASALLEGGVVINNQRFSSENDEIRDYLTDSQIVHLSANNVDLTFVVVADSRWGLQNLWGRLEHNRVLRYEDRIWLVKRLPTTWNRYRVYAELMTENIWTPFGTLTRESGTFDWKKCSFILAMLQAPPPPLDAWVMTLAHSDDLPISSTITIWNRGPFYREFRKVGSEIYDE